MKGGREDRERRREVKRGKFKRKKGVREGRETKRGGRERI